MFAAIGSIIAAIAAIFVAYVGFLIVQKILRVLGRLLGVAAFKASEEIEKRRKR